MRRSLLTVATSLALAWGAASPSPEPSTGTVVATYRASFEKLLAMVKALHDAGVPLVVGTDAMAGLMFHHELALYARAGLRNADILRMATLDAARALRMEKKTGSIAPGKAADLIVVDGDPLAQIADAGHVVSTMRGGITFDAAAVYATVGVRP